METLSRSFDFGKLHVSRLKLPDFYKLRGEIGVKLYTYTNAPVNSSCAHPPPRATAGHLHALSVPGVEH